MTPSGAAASHEPLAIVGLSCLFPKSANPEEFWANVRDGVDAITEIPNTHWNPEDYFDADPKRPDMTYARQGGFLSPIPFDPLEFGITPNNLEAIDTSQLLGLVAAKRALEDAGYGADRDFNRNRVACILGVTGTLELVIPLGARLGHPKWRQALRDAGVPDDVATDVMDRIGESYVPWQENSFPGLLGNVVAGRIANKLNLHGTNCVVDAACASSLSALHLACLELWTGRADMAVTGGVDTFNDIFMYMCFSKTPALSPTGHARPFSEDADGTTLGEGVGMLVVKRLADAQRDGDRIHAVIRGLGTSSDGAGSAVYAPQTNGQIRCIEDAYRVAGVSPETIELVEAHGTGTKVGDAAEIRGLTQVYSQADRRRPWCAVGSIKSQFGHTKAAAGVAGVLKAVHALRHRVLPPTIKVQRPPALLLEETSPFYVNTSARPWVANPNHPRRAAVSAFGFGGSNFHCVLEESPQKTTEPAWTGEVQLAAFSADSPAALKAQLNAFPASGSWSTIRKQAGITRAVFRAEQAHRLVMVLERDRSDVPKIIRGALSLLDSQSDRTHWTTPDGAFYGSGLRNGRLAMLFPGQGSQYPQMLRDLALTFPTMQDVLADADEAFTEGDPDLLPLSRFIYPVPAWSDTDRAAQEDALRATQVAQPAIGAVSLGALAILDEFGVKADVVAGHSYGELTALCASQRFAADSLYRLSMLRGRLMAEAQEVEGGMLAVGASLSFVEEAIREAAVDVVIANRNGPNQVVLSGRLPEIERAADLFTQRNIRGRKLQVAAAFHSPLVAAASARFRPELDDIDFHESTIPTYANTSASEYPTDAGEARDLLAGQLAKPVEFVQQIENMYAAGVRLFVEVGPGGTLTGLVNSILGNRDFKAIAIDASAGRRGGLSDLATTLAAAATWGVPVSLAKWDPRSTTVTTPEDLQDGRLRVPLTGANYVKPRTPRPAKPPMTTRQTNVPATVTASPPSSLPAASANGQSVQNGHAAAKQSPEFTRSTVNRPVSSPAVPLESSPPVSASPAPISAVVQQQLALLQQMQQDTARLHQQFLEGQDQALQTLERLLAGSSPTGGMARLSASPATKPVTVAAPAIMPAVVRQPETPQPEPVTVAAPARVRPAAPERVPSPKPVAPVQPAPRATIIAPPAPPAVAPAKSETLLESTQLGQTLLAVVAEKTGYPAEMLQLSMSLDHDLGIDSIKRVEILSALQEKLPELPVVKPEDLGTLETLADIVALLAKSGLNAPQVVTAAPAVKLADTSGLATTLLAVVAEKTGYPAEMLQLGMSLDHDLGIDSIKRVEILSALQEKLPELPMVKPEDLGTLQSLEDIVCLLAATQIGTTEGNPQTAPPAVVAPAPVAIPQETVPTSQLANVLLTVVAEKTGYPVEMLELGMSLDHDLGIDSIKRVEILSALQEKLPDLPAVKPEDLGTLQTLNDIVQLLVATQPMAAASHPAQAVSPITTDTPTSSADRSALAKLLLEVVAEKTGYPEEMLSSSMSLDHDLGIDSIKRVEILSALQERSPDLPAVKPEDLGSLQTLDDILSLLATTPGPSTAAQLVGPAETPSQPDTPASPTAHVDDSSPAVEINRLQRCVLQPVALTAPRPSLALATGEIWITDDGSELVLHLAQELTAAGYQPHLVSLDAAIHPTPPENLVGLILLSNHSGTTAEDLWCALSWVQTVSPVLKYKSALVAGVTRLDGALGLGTGPVQDAMSGGFAGLIKTVRHEWPSVAAKVIDLAPDWSDSATLAQSLAAELLTAGPIEVGLRPGQTVSLEVVEQPVGEETSIIPIQTGDLVVVAGGARGVTAASVKAFARTCQPRLALLGRSPLVEGEADWLAKLATPADIKSYLIRQAAPGVTPRQIDAQVQELLAQREVRQTLAALRAMGREATYHAVDVRDEQAVKTLMQELQATSGPVRGLIYGAGVLADQKIEEKTREAFDRVYGTKVLGFQNLLAAIDPAELSLLATFSSFTARYGRTGQVDYAIANECLNKVGDAHARQYSGCRVVSFNWGPWEGGMVTPGLKAIFAAEGVGLIPLQQGAQLFATEVNHSTGPTEVVVLAKPDDESVAPVLLGIAGLVNVAEGESDHSASSQPQRETAIPLTGEDAPRQRIAFEKELDLSRAPCLASHVLGKQAVFPVALLLEWFGHAALHQNPGLEFLGIDDLRVFRGIRLSQGDRVWLKMSAEKTVRAGREFRVPLQLVSLNGEKLTPHAAAEVLLAATIPAAPSAAGWLPQEAWPHAASKTYGDLLFHGPAFHGITQVERVSPEGILVRSKTSPSSESWFTDPLRPNWIADPLSVDVALQAVILWCRQYLQSPCLPSKLGAYRQFQKSFPAEVRVSVRIVEQKEQLVRADVEWLSEDNQVLAILTGSEHVVDKALTNAFLANRL